MLEINKVECSSNESINPDGCSRRELTQKSPIVVPTTALTTRIRLFWFLVSPLFVTTSQPSDRQALAMQSAPPAWAFPTSLQPVALIHFALH